MRIVNPAYGRRSEPAQVGAARLDTDWRKDPIVVIGNSKPNAAELLEGLRQKMSAFRSIADIDARAKVAAAIPAPEALLAEVATRYKGAITALAD